MRNIMLYEQLRELYTNYMVMETANSPKEYKYRAGDYFVTITAVKRNHRQT